VPIAAPNDTSFELLIITRGLLVFGPPYCVIRTFQLKMHYGAKNRGKIE